MRFKHEFAVWRPSEISSQVKPVIAVPGHGAYPMGHVCEAVVNAIVLDYLIRPSDKNDAHWLSIREQFQRLAIRIGENRIIAGVHYPYDLEAGVALGCWIGQFFIEMCFGSQSNVVVKSHSFKPILGAQPIASRDFIDVYADAFDSPANPGGANFVKGHRSELMALGLAAYAEWNGFLRPNPKDGGVFV
jgi:PAP2 superfamily